MNRLSRMNVVLVLAVTALGTLAYHRSAREEAVSGTLSTRLPAQARVIRIDHAGSPEIVIENKDDVWRLAAPLAAEADAFHIQRLVAILAARPTQRFDAVRLERFGLDQPRSRITIDDERFAFGTINTVSGEQYVLARNAVYSVAPHLAGAIPANAMQLVRRQLLSRWEVPTRFELGEFSVWHEDGKWLLSPAQGSAGQDDLVLWVESWQRASAARVTPLVPRPTAAEVRIALKSGTWLALGIVQREPELVIARQDEKLQYHFPAATARRLFAPPDLIRDNEAGKK